MSEVRPIDANALLKDKVSNAYISRFEIENEPTLDYEPVVYCKDCEYLVRLKDKVFCTKKARTEFDINTGAQNWLI